MCAFCFFLFLFLLFFHKNPISNKRFYVKTWYFALFSYRFCCSSYKEMTCQSFLLRQQRNSVQRLTHLHSKRSNYYWLSRWPGMRCCLGGGLVLAALTCLNRVSQRLYCILLNVHIYLINFCRIRIRIIATSRSPLVRCYFISFFISFFILLIYFSCVILSLQSGSLILRHSNRLDSTGSSYTRSWLANQIWPLHRNTNGGRKGDRCICLSDWWVGGVNRDFHAPYTVHVTLWRGYWSRDCLVWNWPVSSGARSTKGFSSPSHASLLVFTHATAWKNI